MQSSKAVKYLFYYIHTSAFVYLIFCDDTSSACFCKLEGKIDDCTCSIDTVDYFNNIKIFPRLQSLLATDYFRYIRVNLNHECPFWADDSKCAIKDCSVQTCPEDLLPPGLKGSDKVIDVREGARKYLAVSHLEESCDENYGGLGAVNKTISEENYEEFQKWQEHDDAEYKFCYMDDELSSDVQYVDLKLNPERYTGYKGSSAHRIWNSIYKENCFRFDTGFGPYTTSKNLNAMCLEKRTFYRAISGLHASISIHLCSQYYTKAKNSFTKDVWGINVQEFKRRFDPSRTDSEGPLWLKNLYFAYLLELRALAKAAPYFDKELFYTGNLDNDLSVREGVQQLLEIAQSFPNHFNESIMFSDQKTAKKIKDEFRQHFLNISMIMNCVGCDKCRLWGKTQIQGLGTALKILFSGNLSTYSMEKKSNFVLSRTEIVSLFNAFGRLSNSIYQLENFRRLLKEDSL